MALKSFLKKAEKLQAERFSSDEIETGVPHHDESNWLVSYADMMTLLCAFFIMLFSMAKLDPHQYENVKEALSQQFGGSYEKPNENLGKFVTEIIQNAGIEKQTTVEIDARGVSIAFESTLFFDTLNAELNPDGNAILVKLIDALASRQLKESKNYKVVVEGHTDSRPVLSGIYPSNWELSGARSSRVVRLFIERGFSPANLTSIAFADTRPRVEARNPAGALDETALAKNRRVVLRILDSGVETTAFPEPAKMVTASHVQGELFGPPEQASSAH